MFIPLGTDRPIRRPTKVVYWLIGANVLVHLALMIVDRLDPQAYVNVLAELWLSVKPTVGPIEGVPSEMPGASDAVRMWSAAIEAQFADYAFKPWSLITHQFVHGGLLHLLGNMLFLFVFGPNIEDRMGRWRFLALYLGAGMAAAAAHLVFASGSPPTEAGLPSITIVPPAIGASGAIAGVTGAYLCMFPRTRIKVLLFFFLIGVFYLPAAWFIGISIAFDLLYKAAADFEFLASNVAYEAHLGGYAFGFVIAYVALARGWLAREPYDLFSMHKQARRRRAYRDLVAKTGTGGWSSELAADADVRRQKRRRDTSETHSDAVSEAIGAKRAKIGELLDAGDEDAAAEAYVMLADKHGEQALQRDQQLAVAKRLNALARHTDAAVAYRQFAKRFPNDPETNRVLILLALLQTRQLNDPVGAAESLGRVKPDRLSDQERDLYEALKADAE